MRKSPKITLVGAGPGAADLISVRGYKALQEADVVLYDALVSDELVDQIPIHTPTIYVGKRAGLHSYSQEAINNLLVESARAYGHAVRLKGGDSFVFGRGAEEVNFARQYGIPTTVVPGISSSIGVPALCDIPVTQRSWAESFWVITGVTSKGVISKDVWLAATTEATVVILMGMSKLSEIVAIYRQAQRPSIPIAVIQEGSMESQKVLITTMDKVLIEVSQQKIKAPAVIVIGKVVNSIVSNVVERKHEYSYS